MNMRRYIFILASVLICSLFLTGCFSAKSASSSGRGGEVVGVGGKVMNEPTPYGMVRVNRGFLKMGLSKQDSLWGKSKSPIHSISSSFIGYVTVFCVPVWLIPLMAVTSPI